MPASAFHVRSFVVLSALLLVFAGLTVSVLLPRASASLEGKPRPGKTERTREIAERLKKHRPPVDRDEKRSPKKPAEQKAEKPERDAAWPVIKRDEEAKLDWPSFKPMGGSLFEEESEGAFDKPGEAAEFFNKKRLPKGEKEFPLEEYFRAHEQMRQMPQFSTSLQRFLTKEEATAFRSNRLNKEAAAPQLEAAGWAPLGPGNIGGRTRAILINPQDANIMYAAGVSGGVWKSTNAGQSWTPITDMLANITVSTMAFEPGNPNVIYVGSGEGVLGTESDTLGDFRGAGIFKTTDGGATWARRYACYCRAAWIDPADPDHIILGPADSVDRNGRVEQTRDGGRYWEPASRGLEVPWRRHMVERFAQAGAELLAVLSNGDLHAAPLATLEWRRLLPEVQGVNAATTMA